MHPRAGSSHATTCRTSDDAGASTLVSSTHVVSAFAGGNLSLSLSPRLQRQRHRAGDWYSQRSGPRSDRRRSSRRRDRPRRELARADHDAPTTVGAIASRTCRRATPSSRSGCSISACFGGPSPVAGGASVTADAVLTLSLSADVDRHRQRARSATSPTSRTPRRTSSASPPRPARARSPPRNSRRGR